MSIGDDARSLEAAGVVMSIRGQITLRPFDWCSLGRIMEASDYVRLGLFVAPDTNHEQQLSIHPSTNQQDGHQAT